MSGFLICIQRNHSNPNDEPAGDEDYIPYVPVKERKKAEVYLNLCVHYYGNLFLNDAHQNTVGP